MSLNRPQPNKEAVNYILNKIAIPEGEWSEADWKQDQIDIAERAFWLSRVESARFLDRVQAFLFDTLTGVTEKVVGPDGVERIALRGGDRATFVRRIREFMIQEGMVSGEEEFFDVNQKDLKDIRSERRLRLIYDTNMRQAYGYGQWKQGQKPNILFRFPAQEFVRDREVEAERPRHAEHEGDIRLKSDIEYWANYQNGADIGGFEVPWAPFGFNSGMGLRDVTREKAIELGLLYGSEETEEEKKERKESFLSVNSKFATSIANMSDETRKQLVAELRSKFGKRVKREGDDLRLK